MKILICGAAGQLGRSILRTAPAHVALIALDRHALDVTDAAAVRRSIESHAPALVINVAAYTAVDRAESEREAAFAINADALGPLARSCRDCGAKLIHISTDYVFDGMRGSPYRPDDRPGPLNVYGASKLAGERVITGTPRLHSLLLRTAWLYADEGHNFMHTMLRLFRERSRVDVVADQIGTPTSAVSLARCLWAAVADPDSSGVFHFTDAGSASWYDFAVAIHEEARTLGMIDHPVEIAPIPSSQYPTAARRPSYSVLDVQQTRERWKLAPVHWRSALREVLGTMTRREAQHRRSIEVSA